MNMEDLEKKEKELVLKLNTENLNPTQVRLIKSMNALILQILTAEDESEYFELSASLVSKTAEIITHSDFINSKEHSHLASQALEFAIDFFYENLAKKNLGNIDN